MTIEKTPHEQGEQLTSFIGPEQEVGEVGESPASAPQDWPEASKDAADAGVVVSDENAAHGVISLMPRPPAGSR